MHKFSIHVRLVPLQYARMLYGAFYKKPMFILCTVIGLYFFITLVLHYTGLVLMYEETPYFEIFCAALLLLFPTLIVLMSVSQLKKSPGFKEGVKYIFSEAGVTSEISTGRAEYSWAHFTGYKEYKRYLGLSQNKRMGLIIDKQKLTQEQLNFIRSKIDRNLAGQKNQFSKNE